MKKSLVLGVAVAVSFGFAEAAWVNAGGSGGSSAIKQKGTISSLGSLLNERSLPAVGSIKASGFGVESAKPSLVGLSTEARALGSHWKDMAGTGSLGSLQTDSISEVELRDLGNTPEASTWAATIFSLAFVGSRVWRRSRSA